jgi:putative glutamine amidotransferase
MKIAISKGAGKGEGAWKYLKYTEWMNANNSSAECIDLSSLPLEQAMRVLETCDALMLTGGPDVEPERYGNSRRNECDTDPERDLREWRYVKAAIDKNMPILGICRGMQLLNVYFGGTLVVDIPKDIPDPLIHRNPDEDVWHDIKFIEHSPLADSDVIFRVNSSHHQSVENIAKAFTVLAKSADDATEMMMVKENSNLPSILAVQWHPERMPFNDPMSEGIAQYFISLIQAQSSSN